MADYHPLIARAVAELDNNTGEARRALYERARAALVAQLRGVTPALGESDITRERLALEEAIRKVEGEEARRGRREYLPPPPPVSKPPAAAEAAPPTPLPPAPQQEAAPASPAPMERQPVVPPAATERPSSGPPAPAPTAAAPAEVEPAPEPLPPAAVSEAMRRREARNRRRELRQSYDQPSDADRQATRPAPPQQPPPPQPTAPPPAEPRRHAVEVDDAESARLDDALRKLRARTAAGEGDVVPQWPRGAPPEVRGDREIARADVPFDRPARRRDRTDDDAAAADHEAMRTDRGIVAPYPDHPLRDRPHRRLLGAAVKIVIAVVVLAVLGALAAVGYRERGSLIALYHLVRAPPPPVTREEARPQPKIEDRVGVTQPDRLPGTEQRGTAPGMPAVAQRVVLYEEDPNDPAGKRYVGSVIWRTETVSPGPGLAPELAVKANIEIPERRITMAYSMVRNTDTALPASHTIDIRFNLPPGFPGGGVANVPGILMKQAEQTRGVPLAGIAVKVTNNVFLIGLSSVDSDVQRNTQLLKERTWFDIPIVYANGSRAILAMEKGTPGERAFNDAFTAWGRTGAAAR